MRDNQPTLFESNDNYLPFKFKHDIRLIEVFGGYGSQSLSFEYLKKDGFLPYNFESYKLVEWNYKSCLAYKYLHFNNDNFDYSQNLTKDQLIDKLYKMGLSSDWNKTMTLTEIKRLSNLKEIYNAIQSTHNLVDVSRVKAKDLEIKDTDNYDYVLTYSFPCQDLSNSGLKLGMDEGSNTRSSLLWQVGRILQECFNLNLIEREREHRPKVLLMENVPAVHSKENLKNFNKWLLWLEKLGYTSYYQDLIATNYEIPQIRNRTFMISVLNDDKNYYYTFPEKKQLKLKLKDLLEKDVDEKYYLKNKQIEDIKSWNAYEKPLENMEKIDKTNISPTLTTRSGDYTSGMILIKNATKQGYLVAKDGDGIDISSRMKYHRGNVQNQEIQTIDTGGGNTRGVVVQDNYIGTYQFSKSDKFMQGKNRFQENKEYSDCILTSQKEACVLKDNQELKIRRLTPRECFRLMGLRDDDIDRLINKFSDTCLFHLAGDSIVVNCLYYIFKQMF